MNILLVLSAVPHTSPWSTQVAMVMITCNLLAIVAGRYAIKVRGLGPSIPVSGVEGFGLPELLATTSLGHVIGAASILGLSNVGLIS